jgi:hypothetical protein
MTASSTNSCWGRWEADVQSSESGFAWRGFEFSVFVTAVSTLATVAFTAPLA